MAGSKPQRMLEAYCYGKNVTATGNLSVAVTINKGGVSEDHSACSTKLNNTYMPEHCIEVTLNTSLHWGLAFIVPR